jgi:hypothetical protein
VRRKYSVCSKSTFLVIFTVPVKNSHSKDFIVDIFQIK